MKGAFGNEGALRFSYESTEGTRPMKVWKDQPPNFVNHIRALNGNSNNRNSCRLQRGINKSLARFSLLPHVRRMVELDRNNGRQSCVANQEVQAF
jgi:hypothetical protein